MIEPLLTAAELAEILRFSPATVVDWSERGELPVFKIGGRLRFRESEVAEWLEQKRPGAGGDVRATPATRPTNDVVSQLRATPNVGGDEDAS